ncbi:uncharacterized protein LOC130897370 [Diorhabda carinulata]|uniref:uncharacterized protein LOC130897370 n=1 Tax=Diorhabda carinulata TaxID=1163345 RepID=UPI0025A2FF78|nr:uncharacterized protein LOC130897370 [Diorhabda carinulata]
MSTLLSKFVDTIVSFKDRKGSPLEEILNNINSQRKKKLKNNSLHVKKALEIGVKTGLLKKSNGKFKLGIETKYYDLLKNFRYVAKRWSTFTENRRNGKNQQGKQHRRGKNIKTSAVVSDRSRRPRRKGRKRRERRPRRSSKYGRRK